MIDFSLSEEERAVRDTIRQFIRQEVMPLEPQVLRNERSGLPRLEPGNWRNCSARPEPAAGGGINTPEEYGGIAPGPVMSAIITMETGRTYRELRLLRIFEGTNEIQRRTIARNLLKGHVKLGEIGD
jgi:alkylation response protein AidB-like acyl-CoA dehydrogenase